MSETNTIHIINEEAWTLSEGQKNVLQVAVDHMVEHLEDLAHDHPTAEQYKRRLVCRPASWLSLTSTHKSHSL